jgi:hypothetical protein
MAIPTGPTTTFIVSIAALGSCGLWLQCGHNHESTQADPAMDASEDKVTLDIAPLATQENIAGLVRSRLLRARPLTETDNAEETTVEDDVEKVCRGIFADPDSKQNLAEAACVAVVKQDVENATLQIGVPSAQRDNAGVDNVASAIMSQGAVVADKLFSSMNALNPSCWIGFAILCDAILIGLVMKCCRKLFSGVSRTDSCPDGKEESFEAPITATFKEATQPSLDEPIECSEDEDALASEDHKSLEESDGETLEINLDALKKEGVEDQTCNTGFDVTEIPSPTRCSPRVDHSKARQGTI